jgi:predicted hydrocarbon binding protein
MPPGNSIDGHRPVPAAIFRHDAGEGALRLPNGRRVIALAAPLLQHLHAALHETLGETAREVLYRIGYEWALQDMLRLHQRLKNEFVTGDFDFWRLDPKLAINAWWSPFRLNGWGALTLELSALARGLAFVELHDSAVALAMTDAKQPACHLYAGLFAGAMSFFTRAERHAVEIECRAMHAERCRFVVGPGAEVDSAEVWRQQGTAAAEIVRRLG